MEQKLVDELGDFFARRKRFAISDDYVGMEASRIPELFAEYFDSLGAAEQQQMTAVIVAAALGRVDVLSPYIDSATSLLVDLCLRGRTQYLVNERELLEREFNKPENLAVWSQAGDAALEGLDYKNEWRYALKLWGVLYLLKSERIAQNYDFLLRHSESPHFRNALISVRAMYDSSLVQE